MTVESWIALVLALGLLGLSPGPAWAAVVATSLGRGFRPAAAMAVGIAAGDVLFLLLAVSGLALLAEALGSLFVLVKLAGAGYLVWLGVRLWRRPPGAPVVPEPGAAVTAAPCAPSGAPDGAHGVDPAHGAAGRHRVLGPVLGPALGGFALTLGNPKVIAFYLGFLPAFIDLPALTAGDVGLVAATTFAIIAGMLAGYAGAAAASRRVLRRDRVRRAAGRVVGTTLVGTGIVVATR